MNLRYATWQAVSTKDQAKADKVSLAVQLEKCLDAGHSRGWIHVRDYVVPGQSRTNWISLNIAEKHIPQLHEMLEAAYRGEFDVLIVYDLNRFRSLMVQVYDALCDCGVQILVLSQPREPVEPARYTDALKREMRMNVSLNEILSNNETSQIQIHFRDKMPRRITEKGLHAGLGTPPYGYRKPQGHQFDRDAVLVQVPAEVAVIRQIRDWFFSGCSLTEIANTLNTQKVPSPRGRRWWYPQVRYILENRFYAGIVFFGETRWARMRREGTRIRTKGEPVTNTGKHQPIWDLATHRRILAELERRGQANPGIKTRQLSRLLYCWCGAVMWAQTDQKGYQRWRCSTFLAGHASLNHQKAMQDLTEKIVHTLEHLDQLVLPAPTDRRPDLQAELKDLQARKKRWQDLYEDGDLAKKEYHERVDPLTLRIAKKEQELHEVEADLVQSSRTRAMLEELAVSVATLPHYYRLGDPREVNAHLHTLLARVEVGRDKSLKLVWK